MEKYKITIQKTETYEVEVESYDRENAIADAMHNKWSWDYIDESINVTITNKKD